MRNDDDKIIGIILGSIGIVIISIAVICGLMVAHANYNVWSMKKSGEAEYAFAESQRQIKILEAKASEESAKCYAQAEIIRAGGVAEANKIIGDSLSGNEAYLRYRWIEGLQTNNMSIVYVPTEANLPILEANRWKQVEK